jgi:tetratricopeptide (TPR) repeat protein
MELYQQCLQIYEPLGDLSGKSITLSMITNILMARQEWDAVEQMLLDALALAQRLADPGQVAFNQVKLGQVAHARGDQATALAYYREGLAIFERVGMPREAAQVREFIAQAEEPMAGSADSSPSPAQLLAAVTRAVREALRGERPDGDVQAALRQLVDQASGDHDTGRYLAALLALMEDQMATAQAWEAAQPLLGSFSDEDRRDLLLALANLLGAVGAPTLAITAQEQAVALLRAAGDDRSTLVALSVALYNLAGFYSEAGRHAEAVAALEEVVALDERTEHPDLESDRQVLEAARRRAVEMAESRGDQETS